MADRTLTVRINLPHIESGKLTVLRAKIEKAVAEIVGEDAFSVGEALMITGKKVQPEKPQAE